MNMFSASHNRVVRTDIVQTVPKVIRECPLYVNLHCVEIAKNLTNDILSHLA